MLHFSRGASPRGERRGTTPAHTRRRSPHARGRLRRHLTAERIRRHRHTIISILIQSSRVPLRRSEVPLIRSEAWLGRSDLSCKIDDAVMTLLALAVLPLLVRSSGPGWGTAAVLGMRRSLGRSRGASAFAAAEKLSTATAL